MIIGAHVSVAGGILNAIKKGGEIEAQSLQLFVSAPQSFRTPYYSDEDILVFKEQFKEKKFHSLFFHGIYLINLASINDKLYELSIESLISYLKMGEKLGAVGTIFHIGSYGANVNKKLDSVPLVPSHRSADRREPLSAVPPTFYTRYFQQFDRVINGIKRVLDETPTSQFLIIENNAGGGGRVGTTLEELYEIYKAVDNRRLKVCIDTQHLFASGVNVADYEVFNKWLQKFNDMIGIEQLICIHSNDSKTDLGSLSDRHENIGEGKIGVEGFRNIVKQSLLQDIPFILEVPGENKKGPNVQNINLLRNLSI